MLGERRQTQSEYTYTDPLYRIQDIFYTKANYTIIFSRVRKQSMLS